MKNSFSHPDHFIAFIHSIFALRNSDKNHWLKKGVLATTSVTAIPSARMVVIRGVNEKIHLEIHTDARSNKVLDLQINPQAEILFYDPLTEIQLKCFGRVKMIHSGPLAGAAWEKIPESSKKQYTTLLAPGTVIDHSKALAYKAHRHFCIITLETQCIEYLKLGDPHQRVRWSLKDGEGVLEHLVP